MRGVIRWRVGCIVISFAHREGTATDHSLLAHWIFCHAQIFEADTTTVKNFGVWIRYQSRTGYHNSYKEYRETTMNAAVDALYEEMASRHRVRASCLQIIKIAEVEAKDVRRENTRQFLQDDLSFPVVNKVMRHPSKATKTTFKYKRPNHVTL